MHRRMEGDPEITAHGKYDCPGKLAYVNDIPLCLETGSKCCLNCDSYPRCETRQCPERGFESDEAIDCFRVSLYIRAGEYLTRDDDQYYETIERDLEARDKLT